MGEQHDSVHVPLPDFVREVAIAAAQTVIREHMSSCPIAAIEQRVKVLETRFALLIGALIGSGALGGAIGGLIMKMLA